MKANPTDLGRVVIVTHGHDAGCWCAVIKVLDEQNVLICDGRLRTIAKPKKKRVKHLTALPFTITVEGRGGSGGSISDSDIRKALKDAQEAYTTKCDGNPAVNRMKEECAFVEK